MSLSLLSKTTISNSNYYFTDLSICVQTKDEKDFSEHHNKIKFLSRDFSVDEDSFKSTIPNGSLVILDDFSFQNITKQTKLQFLNVVNYYLRHHHVTLILLIHNIYSTGLLNEILLAPHLFIAYSNLGYYIMKKIHHRLGGSNVLQFWQEPPKYSYNFCYINCNKNYLVNSVEKLFLGKRTTMFANEKRFVIHSESSKCGPPPPAASAQNSDIENEIHLFLSHVYPKNKNLRLVFNIMMQHQLINESLFFVTFPHIHIADFSSFLLNRFDQQEKTSKEMIKLCKYLQRSKIRFPKIAIKNPIAQKLLC